MGDLLTNWLWLKELVLCTEWVNFDSKKKSCNSFTLSLSLYQSLIPLANELSRDTSLSLYLSPIQLTNELSLAVQFSSPFYRLQIPTVLFSWSLIVLLSLPAYSFFVPSDSLNITLYNCSTRLDLFFYFKTAFSNVIYFINRQVMVLLFSYWIKLIIITYLPYTLFFGTNWRKGYIPH